MNELFMNALVYWKTNKNNLEDAWSELCDVLNKYEIELDIVVDNVMELRDENGIEIE